MAERFIINGERYEIPEADDLTLGELEILDRMDTDLGATIGMILIVLQRAGQDVTIDDVRRLKSKDWDVEEDDADPPTGRADSGTQS